MCANTRLEVGQLFEGKYRVQKLLDAGGMGAVYAAEHVDLQSRVALKVVREELLSGEGVAARFFQEARAAAGVRHDNVAQVMDVGRSSAGDPYMVMELLEGENLSRITQGAELPIETTVHYILQVCDGMAYAHSRGVVHRDLKPSNLFLTEDAKGRPRIKILDFGISKLESVTTGDAGVSTHSGLVLGSPAYMSPEQARSSKAADQRSDIWSLGVIVYELLTGQLPFDGEEVGQILSAVFMDAPRPPEELRSEVSPKLSQVVLRCLHKEPEGRFQTMPDVAAALREALGLRPSLPVRAPVPADSVGPVSNSGAAESPPRLELLAAKGDTIIGQPELLPEASPEPVERIELSSEAEGVQMDGAWLESRGDVGSGQRRIIVSAVVSLALLGGGVGWLLSPGQEPTRAMVSGAAQMSAVPLAQTVMLGDSGALFSGMAGSRGKDATAPSALAAKASSVAVTTTNMPATVVPAAAPTLRAKASPRTRPRPAAPRRTETSRARPSALPTAPKPQETVDRASAPSKKRNPLDLGFK